VKINYLLKIIMETKELLKNIEFTVTNRYYASGYDDYMDKLVKEIF
jgi:hypothetical protein